MLFAISSYGDFKSFFFSSSYFNCHLIIGSGPQGMCEEAIEPMVFALFTHLVPQHPWLRGFKIGFKEYIHIKKFIWKH